MQRLHDALSKLAPKSKVGGLGFAAGNNKLGAADRDGIPQNGMYLLR